MFISFKQYFLLVNLFFLLFLFSIITIFHITPVESVNDDDNDIFEISPQDYYDLSDNVEETPFSDQFDEENSIDDDHDTQLPTTNKYEKETTRYLSENDSSDINFIAAGDWNCNKETKKTIKKMTKLEPELVVGLGDYTYQNISPQCWFDISEPIDENMKIVIGNHDLDFQSSYDQLLDHYNLREPYYSFNFYNIHFLAISSEHPFEKGSKQYKFIKSDLEESLQDPSILWRIVFLHKPMYTSANFDRKDSENLKNTFHQLFEKYQIDLVLSGHTQYYQRSLPLLYNNNDSTFPTIIDQNNNNGYTNNKGVIFVTAGTAGDALHNIDYFHPYYVIQEGKFGFLNFDLENNGHTLMGTFYETDARDILDRFAISKDNSEKKTYSDDEGEKPDKFGGENKLYFASTK